MTSLARGGADMRIMGVGFPTGTPVPTRVTACGDGIHTAIARRAEGTGCVCERMILDLSEYAWITYPIRLVLLGGAIEDAAVNETRRIHGRMVTS